MNAPSTDTEHELGAKAPNASIDQHPLQSATPLLSEVVIPGTALAPGIKAVALDDRSAASRVERRNDANDAEQQLLEQLLPRVGKLVDASVRDALSGASQKIVDNVLRQLQHQFSAMAQEQMAGPSQPPSAES